MSRRVITPRMVAFRRAIATVIVTMMFFDVSTGLDGHWLGIFLKSACVIVLLSLSE
jgi:hypothetical protein